MTEMYIKKRDGRVVPFDKDRIKNAVLAAFKEVDGEVSEYANTKAENIANYIEAAFQSSNDLYSVEDAQDLVEKGLMSSKRKDVAKAYILYREERSKARGNLTDKTVLELLAGENEYWNRENSNKNPDTVTVQRDYMAGIVSTDISRRILLSPDIVEAHDAGILHMHDLDYFGQNALTNCCLINLEDMLMNGTVINGVRIDPQHRLLTATTVATQIITAVASSQYGGCTITLTHLAPFVRMSLNMHREDATAMLKGLVSPEIIESIARKRLEKEIQDAVQTFNYQINSMSTTNG